MNGKFIFNRSGDLAGDCTVSFSITAPGALLGLDYHVSNPKSFDGATGTIIIPANQLSTFFIVSPGRGQSLINDLPVCHDFITISGLSYSGAPSPNSIQSAITVPTNRHRISNAYQEGSNGGGQPMLVYKNGTLLNLPITSNGYIDYSSVALATGDVIGYRTINGGVNPVVFVTEWNEVACNNGGGS
jgi:hypothetical protein